VFVALEPVAGAAVEKELTPSATTDDNGEFQLSTYEQGDGAPVGEYELTLRWYEAAAAKKNGPPPGFLPPTDRWKGKYSKPGASRWPITIVEGSNVLDPVTVD
jgi:hypothetical protein